MCNNIYDVVVAGHLCLDIIPVIPNSAGSSLGEVFRPGKLVNVDSAVISSGGPVSNTGIALRKLGISVAFVARVGDDDFGHLLLDRMSSVGNAEGISVSCGENTSYTVVLAAPCFDRIFLHCPGTNNTFASADIDREVLEHARHFHFGYPPLMRAMYLNQGEELVRVFRKAKEAGLTTSLDMSLPDTTSESGQVSWRRVLENVLLYVDIFLPSIEEAFFMLEPGRYLAMKEQVGGAELIDHLTPEDYSRLAKELLSLGTRMTALKSAHRGFYLMTGDIERMNAMGRAKPGNPANWANRELWCPAFHIDDVVSATGSGDSSIAGFIAAFLRGYDVERTLKSANCLGYQNLHAADALSGIRGWDSTVEMVDYGNVGMNDLDIDCPGWHWDESALLMVGPNDAGCMRG